MIENTLLNQDLQEERQESFKIENLEGATWAFRKLRAIEAKKAEIKGVADMERSRIDIWEKQQSEQLDKDKEFFDYVLSEYYMAEKAKDNKFKLSTPYGKVSSRKTSKWIYEDEKELLEYLERGDTEAIRIKKEIDKTYLKKKYKNGIDQETGEILPYIAIEESETITVKAE